MRSLDTFSRIPLGAFPTPIQRLDNVSRLLNTNVYVNIGDEKAILKIDPHDTPETDAPVTFSIPYESVYLFDGETEEVIR